MYSKGHRFRLLSNVFCTSNQWNRVGGIPSLARAIFDRNSMFPTFHGPPQIEKCLNKFAALTDLDPELAVTETQFNNQSFFEDAFTQVDFVELKSEIASRSTSTTVMAYVCRLRPRKGTLLLSKFTANNIPAEFLKFVNNGQDITLPDGRTFLASDFMSAGFAGGNFLSMFVLLTL